MTQPIGDESKVLLIGLPGVGKSTFTAAFWGVVTSSQIPGALRLASYSGDQTYLNGIYEKWSKGLELDRTARNAEGLAIVKLTDLKKSNRMSGQVVIPDLDGDRFQTQWEDRVITREHESHLKSVNSVLFFVHPTKISDGQIHNPEMQALDALFPNPQDDAAETATVVVAERPFNAASVPTQTILTDILQTTLDIGTSIRKIALVVSAWDLVTDITNPADWLKHKLPLLSQYLSANPKGVSVKVWGISAQGVDLGRGDQFQREDILSKSISRIIVTDGDKVDSDITRPLKWLFADQRTNGK